MGYPHTPQSCGVVGEPPRWARRRSWCQGTESKAVHVPGNSIATPKVGNFWFIKLDSVKEENVFAIYNPKSLLGKGRSIQRRPFCSANHLYGFRPAWS